MGYSINDNPPRTWFAGRLYMVEARRCLDNRKGDSPLAFDDLIDLYEAKLNLLRAIRAAMSLAPDKGRCFADSLPELKEKLTTDGFRILCEQVMC